MMDTVEPPVENSEASAGRRSVGDWAPLLVLLSGVAVLALVLLDGPAGVRAVAVLTYLAAVPGLAWVRLIRLPDGLAQLVIGIALSLALGILVAQTMVALRLWSPRLGLFALVSLASVAALLELVRDWRSARARSVRSASS